MKILVDELPDWRGKLNYGDACNLNEIEHECLKLKEVNINES